jgi:hypothetical protein
LLVNLQTQNILCKIYNFLKLCPFNYGTFIYFSVYYVCLSVYYVCLSVCLSDVCLSVWCLSICLMSVNLSVCLLCLSVCLFVCLFINITIIIFRFNYTVIYIMYVFIVYSPDSPESLQTVTSQVLKLHISCIKGLHHHVPVLFDYFHFAVIDTTVHAVLTKLSLPDPRYMYIVFWTKNCIFLLFIWLCFKSRPCWN